MRRTTTQPGRLSVLALVVGTLIAVSLPLTSAVAFDSPPDTWRVEIASTAKLEARGAAVTVPVQVQCPAGVNATVTMSVTQRSGSGTISAFRAINVSCTGGPTQHSVSVIVEFGSRVFKKGPAFADASVGFCQYCGAMDTDSRTITIER